MLTAAKLAERGLLKRTASETDRRLLSLTIPHKGEQSLETTVDCVHRMRERLLVSSPEENRDVFIELLRRFVHVNNQGSRAPIKLKRAEMKGQKQKTSKPGDGKA